MASWSSNAVGGDTIEINTVSFYWSFVKLRSSTVTVISLQFVSFYTKLTRPLSCRPEHVTIIVASHCSGQEWTHLAIFTFSQLLNVFFAVVLWTQPWKVDNIKIYLPSLDTGHCSSQLMSKSNLWKMKCSMSWIKIHFLLPCQNNFMFSTKVQISAILNSEDLLLRAILSPMLLLFFIPSPSPPPVTTLLPLLSNINLTTSPAARESPRHSTRAKYFKSNAPRTILLRKV